MAIAPLQIPGYAAPQSLDFSPLANLGQVYQKANQDAVRRDTLAQLGQGNGQIDPRALLASGDMSLANLGISIQNRQQDQERQARQDQRQTSRDSVDDRFRKESLSLQKSAAARAAEDKFTIKEVTDPNTGATTLVRVNQRGSEGPINTGVAPSQPGGGNPFMNGPQGKLTEGEGKAQGFSDRMLSAEGVLSGRTPETGIGPNTPGRDTQGSSLYQRGLESGGRDPVTGSLANWAQSSDYQQFKQARDNFINAQLRRESGAAINKDEYKKADAQYFPAPGDAPAVIEQKRQNRQDAIKAMGREGGRFYRPSSVPDESGAIRSTNPKIAPGSISQDQYNQLPSGSTFTAPDGSQRIKP